MRAESSRIACVQLSPVPGQVDKNAERVKELTRDLIPGTVDMLILPEMALTGYIFASNACIEPLLEDPYGEEAGLPPSPSLLLARQLATRLSCYVVVGFPWKASSAAATTASVSLGHLDCRTPGRYEGRDGIEEATKGCYNAALLVDCDGQLVHVFRKHFSYEDDKRWASEGPGFQSLTLPRLGKICVAICMDLNPYDFKAPFEAYELAKYCLREQVHKLIMPMAWLQGGDDDDKKAGSENASTTADDLSGRPGVQTINYWAIRLSPFLERQTKRPGDFFFVNCNRTGTEQTSKFAGSSCALHFRAAQCSGSGSDGNVPGVELLGAMGREEAVSVFLLQSGGGGAAVSKKSQEHVP